MMLVLEIAYEMSERQVARVCCFSSDELDGLEPEG